MEGIRRWGRLLGVGIFVLALAACGGDSGFTAAPGTTGSGTDTGGSGGTSGGTGSSSVGTGQVASVTVAAGASSLTADGADSATIRATVLDTAGQPVAGETVTFATDVGTLSATSATTNASGIAEVTLSGTRLGTATVTATAGGFRGEVQVTFVPGPADATKSVLTISPASVSADGSAQYTVKALLFDSAGHPVADGTAVTLRVEDTGGTPVGAVLSTNPAQTAGGAASFTVQAPAPSAVPSGGTATVTAEVATGLSLTGTVTFASVSVSPADVGSLVLDAATAQVVADGATRVQIRATLTDVDGEPIANEAVSMSTNLGSLQTQAGAAASSATTNADGVAVLFLEAPTTAGKATVRAEFLGYVATTQVEFLPGDPDAGRSSITASPASLPADGSSTTTVTVTLADANGNPVADGTEVTLVANAGTVTSANPTTTTNGRATFTVQAPSAVPSGGTATVTAEVAAGPTGLSLTGTVTFTSASVSPADVGSLVLDAATAQVVADGATRVQIRATLTDVDGEPIANEAVSMSTNLGSLQTQAGAAASSATTNADGVAVLFLEAPTTAGKATVRAEFLGYVATTQVEFLPGDPDAGRSSITASPASLPADGSSTTTVTVTLADANGNPVADGTEVTLVANAGTVTSANPTTTTNGRATFTLQAPSAAGTATLSVLEVSGLTGSVTFGGAATGDPASVQLQVDQQNIFVQGVGKQEIATITVTVLDGSGNPIDESSYGDPSLNNLRVTVLAQPHGGEYVTGRNAAGTVVDTRSGPIEVRTSGGSINLNLIAGTRPGVVEVKVEALLDESGAALAAPVTAVAPQVVIASGPPHTIVFSSPLQESIENLGNGNYRRVGKVDVTDRWGNAVPDGTVVQLQLIDSVIAHGAAGQVTAGDTTLTGGGSLLTLTCTSSTSCTSASLDFLDTIERNDVPRGIEPDDVVLVRNAPAGDKGRFVAASPTLGTELEVQNAYGNDGTGLEYVVGAAALGATIAGLDPGSGALLPGFTLTRDGIGEFRVTYPAHNDNSGNARGTIRVGCYGYAGSGAYSTDDKRYTVPQSAQVWIWAKASDTDAEAVSKGRFCFASIAPWTVTALPAALSSGGTVSVDVRDGGDGILLPFVGVWVSSVVTSRDTDKGSDFDVHAGTPLGYDVDGDGRIDGNEDLDGDGNLDVNEDANSNGTLDPGEDLDGDGRLDTTDEDVDGDGRLDTGEDLNHNGVLDPGEDLDGDGVLDRSEGAIYGTADADGDGLRLVDTDGDGAADVDDDFVLGCALAQSAPENVTWRPWVYPNAENGKPQTNIGGAASACVAVEGSNVQSGDSATITFFTAEGAAEVELTIP
nr:invasin domain 3-containing protein [Inmirania thermothiophila]